MSHEQQIEKVDEMKKFLFTIVRVVRNGLQPKKWTKGSTTGTTDNMHCPNTIQRLHQTSGPHDQTCLSRFVFPVAACERMTDSCERFQTSGCQKFILFVEVVSGLTTSPSPNTHLTHMREYAERIFF